MTKITGTLYEDRFLIISQSVLLKMKDVMFQTKVEEKIKRHDFFPTLGLCTTDFSTAKSLHERAPSVTVYVHSLSCLVLDL